MDPYAEADILLGDVTVDVAGKALPSGVVQQMRYLWRTGFRLAREEGATTRELAHSITLQFIRLASKHKVMLPPQVKERICGGCSMVQLPSVTCSVRVRPRSLHSRANRKQSAVMVSSTSNSGIQPPRKLKNEVVSRCLICSHTSRKSGAPRKPARAKTGKTANAAASTVTAAAAGANVSGSPAKNAHSGSKISNHGASALRVAPSSTSTGANSKKAGYNFLGAALGSTAVAPTATSFGGNTISSSSSSGSGSGSGSGSNGILGDFVPLGPEGLTGQKRVSLIDLEQQRKKQKKQVARAAPKQTGRVFVQSALPPRPSLPPSHSLGTIAGLLGNKKG